MTSGHIYWAKPPSQTISRQKWIDVVKGLTRSLQNCSSTGVYPESCGEADSCQVLNHIIIRRNRYSSLVMKAKSHVLQTEALETFNGSNP